MAHRQLTIDDYPEVYTMPATADLMSPQSPFLGHLRPVGSMPPVTTLPIPEKAPQEARKPRLIGLHAPKQAGKDTTFEAIAVVAGVPTARIAFADAMKRFVARACGQSADEALEFWDTFKIDGHVTVEHGPLRYQRNLNGREFIINIGDGAREILHEDVWVDQVLPAAPDFADPFELPNDIALSERYPAIDILVVTDVRRTNEAQRIIDLGGEVWEVYRPGYDFSGTPTETRLPESMISKVIMNCGDIDYLNYRVREAL